MGVTPNPSFPRYPKVWTGAVTINTQLVDYLVVDNVTTIKVIGTVAPSVPDGTSAGSTYTASIDKAVADKADQLMAESDANALTCYSIFASLLIS